MRDIFGLKFWKLYWILTVVKCEFSRLFKPDWNQNKLSVFTFHLRYENRSGRKQVNGDNDFACKKKIQFANRAHRWNFFWDFWSNGAVKIMINLTLGPSMKSISLFKLLRPNDALDISGFCQTILSLFYITFCCHFDFFKTEHWAVRCHLKSDFALETYSSGVKFTLRFKCTSGKQISSNLVEFFWQNDFVWSKFNLLMNMNVWINQPNC